MQLASRTAVDLKPIPVEVCVRALTAAGFELKQRANGFVVMRNGQKLVALPGAGTVDAARQASILRTAGIDERTYRRLIASQSGLFTRLDLDEALVKRG